MIPRWFVLIQFQVANLCSFALYIHHLLITVMILPTTGPTLDQFYHIPFLIELVAVMDLNQQL